jgi:hypothetical protein
MNTLLANAGKAFLKAFLAALLVVAIGISTQPNLNGAVAVGVAGIMASIAAGLAAVQTYVPQLTFAPYLPAPYGSILDSFIRAALGAFVTSIIGILAEPSLAGWKALVVGAIVGALNAGLQAIQGTLTPGQKPVPSYGLTPPTAAVTK